jgi:hypothetical protein
MRLLKCGFLLHVHWLLHWRLKYKPDFNLTTSNVIKLSSEVPAAKNRPVRGKYVSINGLKAQLALGIKWVENNNATI